MEPRSLISTPSNRPSLQSDSAGKITSDRVSYLVDMAKAEALDAMGENRAAVELIERHLEA